MTEDGTTADPIDGLRHSDVRFGEPRGPVLRIVFFLSSLSDVVFWSYSEIMSRASVVVLGLTNQVLAQHDLFRYGKETKAYQTEVYLVPFCHGGTFDVGFSMEDAPVVHHKFLTASM